MCVCVCVLCVRREFFAAALVVSSASNILGNIKKTIQIQSVRADWVS